MITTLILAAAIVQLFGILGYAWDTFRGHTKPNRVTWLFWAIAPLIGTAAALVDGVHWVILPVFIAGFGPLLVLLASFVNKEAYWKLNHFDYLCGAIAALALALWVITKQPLIAIFFAILSDAFAAFPTIIKSWNFPETESAIAYSTTALSAGIGLLAVKDWRPSEYSFPIYLIVVNLVVLLAIYRKRLLAQS